ncbi:MAG TPA: hypothetical protein VH041_10725 [Caldimonas sp.]|nr:hypothetical protein [Caldimonas sp.]HEX4234772.1 hypothetical protein [Caldimonas sp.]
MNAPALEILLGDHDREQMPLSLATEGVLRYVWQSAFGPILIEVHDGIAFVNGEPVMPIAAIERGDAAWAA